MSILLTEYYPLKYDRNVLVEVGGGAAGPIILRNVLLQRSNVKNQNGRIYPRPILEREAKKYQSEFVAEHRALGELDHPESAVVNLKNVSHNVVTMRFEGNDLIGDIEVLSTPSGNILKELLKNGIRLGISSRGLGSVHNIGEGAVEVEDDFSLLCFDVVSNPSVQGAYLNESVEVVKHDTKWAPLNELIYDFLSEISSHNNGAR